MENGVFIVGGSSDLALAIAREYGKMGHPIVLAGRYPEAYEKHVLDLKNRHQVECQAVELDLCNYKQIEQVCAEWAPHCSIALAVSGYLGNRDAAEKEAEELHQILETNFNGPARFVSCFSEAFARKGKGLIIGISSVAGDRGRQSNYQYGAAKAGFSTFLDGLRHRRKGSGVHIMTVKPGFMDTAMTDNMDLPPMLTASPKKAAKAIVKAGAKKRNRIYVLWIWRWIMLVIRLIPEPVFLKSKL